MDEDSIWTSGPLAPYLAPDERLGDTSAMMKVSFLGVAGFALVGLMITSVLIGKDVPQPGTAAYFVNGNVVTTGRHSLDLSRPIYVRGNVPVCPSEEALDNYSGGDSQGCTVLPTNMPAGLIGMMTDGMREPTFQMQMNTPDGTIRGWVDYHNLTN